jgi:periplasmic protein TonB
MRKYTLLCSIVVHAAIVGAAFVVSIVATDALPAPLRSTRFVVVNPPVPTPPEPARPLPKVKDVPSIMVTPLVEPETVAREVSVPQPVNVARSDDGIPEGGIPARFGNNSSPIPPDLPPPLPPQAPVRVGGLIRPPQRIRDVAAQYPEIARSARVSGVVILEAVIAEDGAVRDVKILRSIPLLDKAAVDAVRQWRFTPTLLNDQPIPIVMTVTVAFTLN